jgi:preprotein translocase subunit SecG
MGRSLKSFLERISFWVAAAMIVVVLYLGPYRAPERSLD